WYLFGREYCYAGLAYFLESCVKLGEGITLGYLLDWFQDTTQTSNRPGYLWAMGLTLCVAMHAILHHVEFFLAMRVGMQLRATLIATIYRKCLDLSISHTSSTGLIVNLVSNDVQRFEDAAPFAHYLWLGPVEVMLATYFIYRQIGYAAFAAVFILVCLIPFQSLLSRRFAALRRLTVKFRDDRIKNISDMLAGMQVVKLYAWEEPFADKITEIRDTELKYIKQASVLRALNEALYFASSALVSLFAFITYYLIGGVFTAANVFTVVTYLASIRLTMTSFFPKAFQFVTESKVSLQRIQEFLSLPDIGDSRDPAAEEKILESTGDSSVMIHLANAAFAWGSVPEASATILDKDDGAESDGPREILTDLNFQLRSGELVGICGPVGSGKSSLANAVLGEMDRVRGQLAVRSRKIAYAAQTPWIVAGTVKDNICFGSPFREKWFWEVVHACAMTRDIDRFSDRENTVIVERGVTLSGGQRARLALARAVYYNADIYVLDDPLSAVDTNVGRHLFNECIKGVLRSKAVLLITHQLQYIRDCDKVLLLEKGTITGAGPFDKVMHTPGSSFASALRDYAARPADMDQSVDDPDDIEPRSPVSGSSAGPNPASAPLPPSNGAAATAGVPAPTGHLAERSQETAASGTVSAAMYLRYFSAGAGIPIALVMCTSLVLGQGVAVVTDWWLSHWSQKSPENQQDPANAWIFAALVVSVLSISCGRAILFFLVAWASGKVLFKEMLHAVFRSPMVFFQDNPHGRLMNRFSKDQNLLDEMLPQTFFDFTQCAFQILGTFVIAVIIVPYVLVIMPVIGVVFYFLRKYYLTTSRQIKRIESITRSPVYSNVPATLEGLSTVRAFSAENRFRAHFASLQNENTRIYFAFLSAARWLGLRLDILAAFFLGIVAFMSILLRHDLGIGPGLLGLLLSYILQLMGLLQWAVRQSAEVENLMVSVERVDEYTRLTPEAPPETAIRPPPNWPSHGDVAIASMSLTYPNQPSPVLHDISIHFTPGLKVGIVGRTGAGKSSFLQALFRLVEPGPPGSIVIDGIKTSDIGLKDLRSAISIIPQEPFCFKGTLRFNIDPFAKFSDETIWRALEAVELKRVVELIPEKLEAEVAENGSNWSVGERQLICLARAILRNSKLIVMDEATSAVDMHTDALIQSAIRDKEGGLFSDATVMTIAHRLNTVIDYDRILVLDYGHIVEYGTPHDLLEKDSATPDAWFARMVAEMGEEPANHLKRLALEKELERRAEDASAP
ncbi:P-loop containing nucleoside triphosphate hydrolase protein, partial [Blyttiomyces helicus]